MTLEYDVVRSEMQYSIWPMDHPLPSGYSYAGPVGTLAEMETLLAQQFVETAAAHYYKSTAFGETAWGP